VRIIPGDVPYPRTDPSLLHVASAILVLFLVTPMKHNSPSIERMRVESVLLDYVKSMKIDGEPLLILEDRPPVEESLP
jgi:hypothetical protein